LQEQIVALKAIIGQKDSQLNEAAALRNKIREDYEE
jgi:hypothetical protein